MAPDERALSSDLARPAFRLGEADGRWRPVKVAWPHVFIAVTAKDQREFVLRFDCTGFPASAPTAGPWDMERNAILAADFWPRSGGGRLGTVFRLDWKNGAALYLPCDRESIAGHDGWHTQLPSKLWRPSAGLVQYLELVYELLNSRDYQSPSRTAA